MMWVYEIEEKLQDISKLKEVLKLRSEDKHANEYSEHLKRIEYAYKQELRKARKRKQPEHAERIRASKYEVMIEREVKWRHYLNM